MGICVEECETNLDCEAVGKADHLCCSNGCGHTCMQPEGAPKKVIERPFELVAVLRKPVFSEVTKSLPHPTLSVSELRSVKMLTVKYASDQRDAACRAFGQLQSHPEVSSAEWGSVVPKCAAIEL